MREAAARAKNTRRSTSAKRSAEARSGSSFSTAIASGFQKQVRRFTLWPVSASATETVAEEPPR